MYIVYYSVYCDYFGVLIGCCVSELHAKLCPQRSVWPEIVYCCFTRTILFTTMFIMITVVFSLKSMRIPCFVSIIHCVSELHGHPCSYRNVWPEAVYCCFTRTTLFTELFTYLYDQNLRLLSLHQVSLLYFCFLR